MMCRATAAKSGQKRRKTDRIAPSAGFRRSSEAGKTRSSFNRFKQTAEAASRSEQAMAATKTIFRGSYTALVTPFKAGALDEEGFRAHVAWQIAEGSNGLVPVGTTGEIPTLSHDDHAKVV